MNTKFNIIYLLFNKECAVDKRDDIQTTVSEGLHNRFFTHLHAKYFI